MIKISLRELNICGQSLQCQPFVSDSNGKLFKTEDFALSDMSIT